MNRLRITGFLLGLVLLITGFSCSTNGNGSQFNVCSAVTSNYTQQHEIGVMVATLYSLHKTGMLADADYQPVRGYYNSWYSDQPNIVSDLVKINDVHATIDSSYAKTYNQDELKSATDAANVINIYDKVASKFKLNRPTYSVIITKTCSMTDSGIKDALTISHGPMN